MRHPQHEAAARVPGRQPRVLEPSPPTVSAQPWLADDPVAGGDLVPVDRPGVQSWNEVAGDDAELATWCADRWLGAWRRLRPLPPGFGATRRSLHAVAEHVFAPARHRANGKIGLRYTYRGFGTPFFGHDQQLRIEDGALVVDDLRVALVSVADAARRAGIEPGAPRDVFVPATPLDPGAHLDVDGSSARALGDWFGFCASVLEQVRDEASATARPGRVQLWPEHFDMAVDLGDEEAGQRANFGGSPGDADHAEPYLYVGLWGDRSGDGYWNEPFGASLDYADLAAADDPRAAALEFLRHGRDLLDGGVVNQQ